MKQGDLVRVVQENLAHGGKYALIIGTDVSIWYDTERNCETSEIVFEILLDSKIKRGVGSIWLELVSEAG